MLDGFTKRDFAVFAAALFVAGALDRRFAVGFCDLPLRFAGHRRGPHPREIIFGND